jgi:hypothetical protein
VAIHPYNYNVCWVHIHPNAIPNYMAIETIATILVVATSIDRNVSLRSNNHNYCNKIKKPLQSVIAILLLATTFNQSYIIDIGMYCIKYGPIATIFYHGN